MTITTRLAGIVIFIFVSTLLGSAIVLSAIVLPGFTEIEIREARAAVTRVDNAIESEIEEIDRLVVDWAIWDDTWRFIRDRNEDYVASNLVSDIFVSIDASLIWFADRNGRKVWAGMTTDREDGAISTEKVPERIGPEHVLSDILVTGEPVKGIIAIEDDLFMMSASPILRSDGSGESRGMLLFGRRLDSDRIARLSERVRQSVSGTRRIDATLAQVPPDIRAAIISGQARSPVLDTTGSDSIDGYLRIDDIDGQPVMLLSTAVARDISRFGKEIVLLSAIVLLVSSGSALAIGYVFARKTIARPAEMLIRHIEHVGRTGDLGQTIDLPARSEFSRIAETLGRMQQDLQKVSHFDPVTDLPNRLLFQDRANQALIRARREGTVAAIIFIDLDRFKNINDTHGHHYGDCVLRAIGERLVHSIRKSDTVARLGGDEFGIVASGLANDHDAEALAKTLVAALDKPITADNRNSFVGASIGIAMFPADGGDLEELLKNSDIAMFRAKASGGGFQFFGKDASKSVRARLKLENDLRQAMNEEALEVFYQPQVTLPERDLCGAEALVRWKHPENGWLTASQFMPFIEEIGLYRRIDEWVLRRIGEHGELLELPEPGFTLAVNLSSREFQTNDLSAMLDHCLRRFQGFRGKLEFEVTENALVKRSPASEEVFSLLESHGATLALDDFGTGYSSLAYLKQLPVGTLKIDSSFVQDIADNPVSQSIVRAIISLGESLSVRVIAEGVENERQEKALIRFGCRIAQGNHFAPPEPPEIFSARFR